METLIIATENRKATWGEELVDNGFEKEGRLFDKYNKKYDCFSKDGKMFTATAQTNEKGERFISLTDVTNKNLR